MSQITGRGSHVSNYGRDWRGIGAGEFMERPDSYLRYFCERHIKKRLGWLSPKEFRLSLGYS